MTPRHSSPLLLVLGALIAWTSIRTVIVLADETGARLAAANTPRSFPPRVGTRSARVASPDPQRWSTIEQRQGSQRRDRLTSAPARLRQGRGSEASGAVQPSLAGQSLTPRPERWSPVAVSAIPPLAPDPAPMQPVLAANSDNAQRGARPYSGTWASSAWAYIRPDMARGPRFDLARLGGSQIGLRVDRRMDRAGRVTVFARMVSSGAIGDGLEGAAGLALRPSRSLPVALVIERREQLAGAGGRSSFAAYATGGASNVPLGQSLTIDAYGAAGVVGVTRRDLFAEGSAVASRRLTSVAGVDVAAGAGAWGAAQPGATRLDIGPRLSAHLPIGDARPLLAIDWRQRVAGDAAPSSGVALTLAADF